MIKKINIHSGTDVEVEILHTPAKLVTFPLKPEVLEFIQNLYDTIKSLPGVPLGLAANQIAETTDFIPKMFLALDSFDEQGDPIYKLYIDPEVRTMGSAFKSKESCYSVDAKPQVVQRKKNIEIKYFALGFDNEPEYIVTKLYGEVNMAAIIIQHEYDHLLGLLIND